MAPLLKLFALLNRKLPRYTLCSWLVTVSQFPYSLLHKARNSSLGHVPQMLIAHLLAAVSTRENVQVRTNRPSHVNNR